MLDGSFSFNDCLFFAMRIDTNKVPGDLKKAYQLMEEEAAAKDNPSGFISKKQKKEVSWLPPAEVLGPALSLVC